jgi:hypothetical protein
MFTVTLEDTDRIQIKRVDMLGSLPTLNNSIFSVGVPSWNEWYLTSGLKNHYHFGLNKATRSSQIPTSAEMTGNIYNASATFSDDRESGFNMRSNYQSEEFSAIPTQMVVDSGKKQTQFFPGIVNLNCHSTILVKSSRIKANISNEGKTSNVIAKIPINVQSGHILNYEPKELIRFNLGNSSSIKFIDITLTDNDGNILDFNGQPHDLAFLFETWDIVSIPLNRKDHFTAPAQNPKTISDGTMPHRYEPNHPDPKVRETFWENALTKRRQKTRMDNLQFENANPNPV